jgi:1-acyl-sn-glycerol-3-phosphate acyltransferase
VIRRIIVAILNFTLRIYFRRIEITGLEHVPKTSPAIFVLNHPNALVDPVLLCLVPRKVCFHKAPLFRMPCLATFVRRADALPAYRHQDQALTFRRTKKRLLLRVACWPVAQRRHLSGRRLARRPIVAAH